MNKILQSFYFIVILLVLFFIFNTVLCVLMLLLHRYYVKIPLCTSQKKITCDSFLTLFVISSCLCSTLFLNKNVVPKGLAFGKNNIYIFIYILLNMCIYIYLYKLYSKLSRVYLIMLL